MTKRDVLRAECEAASFTFDTYSPGDGVTRYKFMPVLIEGFSRDYFEERGDYIALGWKEALAYATGRVHGTVIVNINEEE